METDEYVKAAVSANLKELMGDELSQSELSRRTGDPITTINQVFHGHVMPGAGLLARIADALGTTVDALLSRPKKNPEKSRRSA